MKVVLPIMFIGAVAAGAIVLSQRPTKLSGQAIADDLLAQFKERGINEMTCDDSVIGKDGARFVCHVGATDGSHAHIQYTMDRKGSITGTTLDNE